MLNIENQAPLNIKDNNRENFLMVKRWLENRNAGKTFVDYFHQYNYKSIAIYGAGDLGKLIYEEIKSSDITVKYFIDRGGEGLHAIDGIPVITIPHIDEMGEVDILIVTISNSYDLICEMLARYAPKIRTLSLKEAIYEF